MKLIKLSSKLYPETLKEISDPPKQLYIAGSATSSPVVAIVGSRVPTSYGAEVTYRLSYDLAKIGITIVSGLAYGIDTIAHQAAIDAGGKTIAVLGSGLDTIYPRTNEKLARDIISTGGTLLSEYPPGTGPRPYHFPQRNRIIAGLCAGVIVTEANAKSGSLITAALALEANRVVMAVPGNITSPRSAGPNYLLKLGAGPLINAADAVTLLGLETNLVDRPTAVAQANSLDESVLSLIRDGHNTTPAIVEHSPFGTSDTIATISNLEISGLIKQPIAGQWIATNQT